MRRLPSVLLATAIGLLGFAGLAGATSLSLRWTGTTGTGAIGGSSINVSSTTAETLTLDLILDADAAGVYAYFLSLKFDTDAGNELNVLSYAEHSWANAKATRVMTQLTNGIYSSQESETGLPEGQLFTFDGYSLGTGIASASMVFGTVVFQSNPASVATDGDDIFLGFFVAGVDAIFENSGNQIFPALPGASVNVPEPGVLALLGVGAAALLLSARRRS